MNEKTEHFLNRYGIESGLDTVRRYALQYRDVIIRDLADPPALSMLKTYIRPAGKLNDASVSAIDAGGTRLRGPGRAGTRSGGRPGRCS